MRFLIFWAISCAALACLATSPYWLDRVIVFLLRTCRIYAFPSAIRVAMSLEQHPEQWKFSKYEASHPTIGSVSFYVGAASLHLDFEGIEWRPNWIERRIIFNAVRLVQSRRIAEHINRTA